MRSKRSRVVGALLAGGFVVGACGGSDDDGGSAEPAADTQPAPPDELALQPESDIGSNVLPDLIVDNVSDGNKVNLRNTFPADQPVLIWMYAPH